MARGSSAHIYPDVSYVEGNGTRHSPMMSTRPIVYVVDDDAEVRDVVARLVESVGLAATAFSSAQDFLDSYDGSRPGCIVLDLRMPVMTGIEALTRFAERDIRLPVIMLTGHGDVPSAVRSLKRGAADFIEKPFNPQVLLERIQSAVAEDAVHAEADQRSATLEQRFSGLSPRETEILDLVIEGKTSKQIARQLGISDKTVDVHRTNLMRKVGVTSVAELVKLAVTARKSSRGA